MWRVPKPRVILERGSTGGFFVLVLLLGPGLRAQLYIGGEAGWTDLSGQTDTISGITSPTARFNGGFNTGVRGGYEWGPWRFEEEYSYRQNGARDVVGSNFTVNAAGGDRHSNSIMTNVLYDVTPGYPITPHVGFGVGAADVFDGLKLRGIGQVLNGNSWQFGYQGIAGIRYHLSGAFTLDLDYRFFATIGPSFSIPRANLQYPLLQDQQLCRERDLSVRTASSSFRPSLGACRAGVIPVDFSGILRLGSCRYHAGGPRDRRQATNAYKPVARYAWS
jgi:opacity protein-like surface antigen